ncbi:MAG TPA: hypothetical protein VGR35_02420 [Tepidisphaeraceae bacterium]|nr:hypothetical protein [Tepidisphaeraceae bacterium]
MNRSSSRRSSSRPDRRRRVRDAGAFGAAFDAARERAGAEVEELVEQVKHEGQDFLAKRKSLLAEQFTDVSGAIRRAADKLHDTDSEFIAGYVDRAADQVEEVGRYIEQHDLREVIEDAGVVARRQPLLFGGAMFLAGLAAARILKAATDGQSTRRSGGRSRRR